MLWPLGGFRDKENGYRDSGWLITKFYTKGEELEKIKLINKRVKKKDVCSSRNNFAIISCANWEFIIESNLNDQSFYKEDKL